MGKALASEAAEADVPETAEYETEETASVTKTNTPAEWLGIGTNCDLDQSKDVGFWRGGGIAGDARDTNGPAPSLSNLPNNPVPCSAQQRNDVR
jgi:hypothetical protein